MGEDQKPEKYVEADTMLVAGSRKGGKWLSGVERAARFVQCSHVPTL